MGGSTKDILLFGGLSAYAIAGCFAQDLRVVRNEGSVGTVFSPGESLQNFFQSTSFLPFVAALDGRQSLSDIVDEIPWIAIAVGIAVGYENADNSYPLAPRASIHLMLVFWAKS